MMTDDFSTPRRMSVSAFVIMLAKVLRRVFVPLMITFMLPYFTRYGDGYTDGKLLLFLVAFIGLSLIIAFFYYYFSKYYIEDGNLIIRRDFIAKNITSIPLSKIHALRTNSGLLYRVFGVRGVSVDTLASKEQEVELILDEEDWKKLLLRIQGQEVMAAELPGDTAEEVVPELPEEVTTIRPDVSNLVKDALCQNHLKGFAVLAGAASMVLGNLSDVDEDALEKAVEFVDVQAHSLVTSVTMMAICIIVAYFVIVMLWVGRMLLRYGEMSVKFDDSRLTVERGLVSRYTSRFARGKVIALTVKQTPLEKLAGLDTVKLKQAENVGDDKEKDDISFYGAGLTSDLQKWWLGDDFKGSAGIASAQSGRGVMWRVVAINAVMAAVIFVALWCFEIPVWGAVLALGYMAFSFVQGYMAKRHSNIKLFEGYMTVGSGRISEVSTFLKYSDVEGVALRQTPLTPFTGRMSIVVATSGERHVVTSLLKTDACRVVNLILDRMLRRSA